ncbi:MAG: RnfABCDGE type electron transport complex subunit D [Deltaproteobacteria bacterium]|nr:RnfABCDGE type electron transport complex subunit D [Deltaproteobacteria bacterium]
MNSQTKLIVSHAPFLHNGSGIAGRQLNIICAALPAALLGGVFRFGIPAIGVVCLAVSTAMLWELAMNKAMKRSVSIGDGNAALIGLLFAMMLPATAPWWLVITGTFVAIVVGKQIFGGIGGNAFNPVALAIAILMVSWKDYFDFNAMLANYSTDFPMAYPLAALKNFGAGGIDQYSIGDFLIGRQAGGIGATFGIGLILGGLYLIARGFIRWEIPVSYLAGVFITAFLFNQIDPARYADPFFHICTGYTLIGAFFLATEDSSSPVNAVPMLIYGAAGGLMTVLIRNIGAYIDGTVLAVLLINLINPLLDKIRPKAMGKAV